MKIMMVSAYHPKYHKIWGGAEREAERIGDILSSKGEEIYYFCKESDIGKELPENFISTETLREAPLGQIPFISGQIEYFGAGYDFVAAKNFGKALNKVNPDIVHFHHFMPFSISLVDEAKRRKIPTVLSIYDYRYICIRETLFKENEGIPCSEYGRGDCIKCVGFKKLISARKMMLDKRKKLFSDKLSLIDSIVTLSENSKWHMIRGGYQEEKMSVINLSFDFNEIGNEEYQVEPGLILFVGWIQPRKGTHIILKAFEQVAKKIPDAKLYLFGGGDDPEYMAKIEEMVKASGLSDKVKFMGRQPYSEVRQYMKKANVIMIAEQWPNMSPLTMVEAMAYKRAVVAGNIGGIPEFIEDGKTGYLVMYDDPDAYADAAISLIENLDLARSIGESAAAQIKDICNADKIAEKYIDLYTNLSEKKKARV